MIGANGGRTPLFLACRDGDLESALAILETEEGAHDIDRSSDTGATPLYIASQNGHVEIVRLLVSRGANVDRAKRTGATPLSIAAQLDGADVVRELLAGGAADREPAVIVAASQGQVGALAALLEPPGLDPARLWKPLADAARLGAMQVCRLLLAAGADPTTTLRSSTLAAEADLVTVALMSGRLAVVEELLLPALEALQSPKVPTVRALLADERARRLLEAGVGRGTTPLHRAAREGLCEVVQWLLDLGVGANCLAGTQQLTALLAASSAGQVDTVRLLLAAGADPALQDSQFMAPMHVAASKGHVDVVLALLAAGAPVDQRRTDLATPLCLAAESGHADLVELLTVEHGAHVNVRRSNGRSLLMEVAAGGRLEVLQLLIRLGAEVDLAPLTSNKTALAMACHARQRDCALALLQAGADPNKSTDNENVMLPLKLAAAHGDARLCRALLRAGARAAPLVEQVNTQRFQIQYAGARQARAILDTLAAVDALAERSVFLMVARRGALPQFLPQHLVRHVCAFICGGPDWKPADDRGPGERARDLFVEMGRRERAAAGRKEGI